MHNCNNGRKSRAERAERARQQPCIGLTALLAHHDADRPSSTAVGKTETSFAHIAAQREKREEECIFTNSSFDIASNRPSIISYSPFLATIMVRAFTYSGCPVSLGIVVQVEVLVHLAIFFVANSLSVLVIHKDLR